MSSNSFRPIPTGARRRILERRGNVCTSGRRGLGSCRVVACHSSGFHELHETLVGSPQSVRVFFYWYSEDRNALEVVNSYFVALGQMAISELPLDPSGLDQIPQIKTPVLVTLDSFNLEATPVTTVTGATWTELHAQTGQPGNQRWERGVLRVS